MFHGLSAFPITPADRDGHVDTAALGRLLARLVEAGVDSIGLLGSTGTYAYLALAERRRAVTAAADSVSGRIPLIVGVGALRTDEAVGLALDARDAGADGLLLAPVSYTPLTEEEVYQHFRAVAGATELPLCIYNNPTTTRFTFSPSLLERLAALDTVAAVKMPLPTGTTFAAELEQLRTRLPADFLIGYSGDWGCADALLAGADAWYSVVAGVLPEPAVRLTRAAQAGDEAQVRQVDASLEPLWALFRELGSLRVAYAAANLMGLTQADPPLPILPLADVNRHRVAQALDGLGIPHG